jgi:hypothetical protein
VLDFKFPLSPVQALGIALSSFVFQGMVDLSAHRYDELEDTCTCYIASVRSLARWSRIAGRVSLVAYRWSRIAGRVSLVAYHWSDTISISISMHACVCMCSSAPTHVLSCSPRTISDARNEMTPPGHRPSGSMGSLYFAKKK